MGSRRLDTPQIGVVYGECDTRREEIKDGHLVQRPRDLVDDASAIGGEPCCGQRRSAIGAGGRLIEFRGEVFNTPNRAHFGSVIAGFVTDGVGVVNDTTTTGREIQFGLKLVF